MKVSALQVILPNLKQWSTDQVMTPSSKKILSGAIRSAFKIEPRHTAEDTAYFDISTKDKWSVFNGLLE